MLFFQFTCLICSLLNVLFFGFGLISSSQQVRRQFQGGRLAPHPAYLQARPPPSHGPSRKTPGAPRTEGNTKQPSDGGTTMNMKAKGSSAAARLKDVMRVSALLSSGSKTSGQPPAIHPPWNKARVRPVEEGEGSRDGLEERKAEGIGRGLERGEAWKRENKGGGRDEATERGGERGGRGEVETWGRSIGGGMMNNEMRNAIERGEGVRPEHRGELPGLPSAGLFASLDGGIVINGSYFQTSVEASKPPPVKKKLSEALSLISLARRVQGPARVGDEQWSNGKSWDRERNSRKMYGSAGDMSVSASVSERAMGEERRRWENSSSEVRWKREKRFHDSDSETGNGSKESPSEFSLSAASSPTSSVTAEHDKTESDTETEKNESDSGTDKEEGTPDTESESGSQSRSESERESGLESEDERKEFSRKPSKGGVSNSTVSSNSSSRSRSSSAKVKRERSSHSSNTSSYSESLRYSSSTVRISRPQTSRHSRSSHETIEEESEEDEELEEEGEGAESVGSRSLRQRATGSNQSDIGSGVIDTSDDLSPIIEDTEEEEERSSDHGGDEDEEEGDLENELAD